MPQVAFAFAADPAEPFDWTSKQMVMAVKIDELKQLLLETWFGFACYLSIFGQLLNLHCVFSDIKSMKCMSLYSVIVVLACLIFLNTIVIISSYLCV